MWKVAVGRESKGRVVWFMSEDKVIFRIRGEKNLESLADDLCMNEIEMSSINEER